MEFLVVLCAGPQGDCAGHIPRNCILSEKPEVCGIIPAELSKQPPPASEVAALHKGAGPLYLKVSDPCGDQLISPDNPVHLG